MPETFIIGDTHFGHAKILEFEAAARPFTTIEEHDEELVRRWNSVVTHGDKVWHLGDVLFGEKSFVHLSRLNGRKSLILGNHDKYPIAKYLPHFGKIYGAAKFGDVLMTHIPIHPYQFYRFKGNLHGHMHSGVLEDKRYVNVSAERNNLTPRPIEEALAEIET